MKCICLQDPSLQSFPLSRNRDASVVEERTSWKIGAEFLHIFGERILVIFSHEPFLYLIRLCPNIPVKLNSFALEVFRLRSNRACFGLDDFGLDGLGEGVDCLDPPLCRGPSQGTCSSCTKCLVCACETGGKTREENESELVQEDRKG